jgi:hypothetical protein
MDDNSPAQLSDHDLIADTIRAVDRERSHGTAAPWRDVNSVRTELPSGRRLLQASTETVPDRGPSDLPQQRGRIRLRGPARGNDHGQQRTGHK